MNQRAILLVWFVLSAASPLAISLYDNYLDWPNSIGGLPEITKALLQLQIQNGEKAETIFDEIRKAYGRSNWLQSESKVYRDLIRFARHGCEPSVIDRVLEIFSLMHEHKELDSFTPFLIKYGLETLRGCSLQSQRFLSFSFQKCLTSTQKDNLQTEDELDKFFSALLGLGKRKQKDDEMLRAVKGLSFTENEDMQIGPAVKLAKKIMRSKSKDSFEIINAFLKRCSRLKMDRENDIKIVALEYTLSEFTKNYPVRVQKVLEYTRVCLSWWRQDMRLAAEENIRYQLTRCPEGWSFPNPFTRAPCNSR